MQNRTSNIKDHMHKENAFHLKKCQWMKGNVMPFLVCLEPIVEVKQENDWKCDWIFYLYFLSSFTIDTSKHNKNYIQTKNETF